MSENQKSQLLFQFSVLHYFDFLIFLYFHCSNVCFSTLSNIKSMKCFFFYTFSVEYYKVMKYGNRH